MTTKVLVLGSTGMLGHMVTKVLKTYHEFKVVTTSRDQWSMLHDDVYFDVGRSSIEMLIKQIKPDWIINCIGVIKPYIKDFSFDDVENAIKINAIFPFDLARSAERNDAQVIQIATDCVYDGALGGYLETSPQTPIDVYGKTKALGEVPNHNFHHLRCCIIGPELKDHLSLMDWFLTQKPGASIDGYRDHYWNGITTLHFAKICAAYILNPIQDEGRWTHIIPKDEVTKLTLLCIIKKEYGREDIIINSTKGPTRIDRTLKTLKPATNESLWQLAGYEEPPTIEQMIKELRGFQQ